MEISLQIFKIGKTIWWTNLKSKKAKDEEEAGKFQGTTKTQTLLLVLNIE